MELIKKDGIRKIIKGKTVIILGSAPSVINTPADTIEAFDVIVRLNNYSFFNSSHRIDIFYSYFGKNIKKTPRNVIDDKVKVMMCKYPNADFRDHNGGRTEDGISGDFRQTYTRGREWPVPAYIPPLSDFTDNFNMINRILTTGMSAIVDILRFNPSMLYVCGFDFFKSKKHNIVDDWRPGDGGHDNWGEMMLMKDMLSLNERLYVDKHIRGVLHEIKFESVV